MRRYRLLKGTHQEVKWETLLDPTTGKPPIDPNTGKYQVDPATGQPRQVQVGQTYQAIPADNARGTPAVTPEFDSPLDLLAFNGKDGGMGIIQPKYELVGEPQAVTIDDLERQKAEIERRLDEARAGQTIQQSNAESVQAFNEGAKTGFNSGEIDVLSQMSVDELVQWCEGEEIGLPEVAKGRKLTKEALLNHIKAQGVHAQ
jgi:hypothetical protein